MLRPLFETSQDHNTSLSGGILVHYLFQRPRARSVMGTGGVERLFFFSKYIVMRGMVCMTMAAAWPS